MPTDNKYLKSRIIIILSLFFFSGLADASETTSFESARMVTQHIITISGFEFSPNVIEVNKGDIITWQNKDIAPHNIVNLSTKSRLSVDLLKGESFSLQVDSALSYLCGFHPSMQGRIIIN